MNENPSHLVYQHLERFLKHRGLTTKAALNTPRDKFTSELGQIGYFRLDAENPKGHVVVILILALCGKYTDHGPQLKSLIASLNSEDFARESRFAEVIIIAPEEVLKKKNMTDAVYGFRQITKPTTSESKKGGATKKGEGAAEYYNIYAYSILSVDIPQVQCIPPHVIADHAEVQTYLTRERLTLSGLKKLSASSPPVVWIGARPGQVVRIISPSESAGEAYDYYIITPI